MKRKKPTKVAVKRIKRPSVSRKSALGKWGAWKEIFISTGTNAGIEISNENALKISTVFACIRNISEDVAKVPLKIYKYTSQTTSNSLYPRKNGKELLPEHPLSMLLNHQPNPEMASMDFRQTLTAHCLGWGNGYAEIVKDVLGNIISLYPIHPSKVKPKRNTVNDIVYEVRQENGSAIDFSADRILHIRGLGDDGLVGHNVIQYSRESLGLAKAAETFGATYFGNNTVLGGILTHPENLSKEAQERLLANIREKHQGSEKAHNLMILEEGMKFEKMVIPPEESQFLETRQFTVPEICRWFRMPPHKVADLQRATFSNIEHQDLEYVKDCLTAWFKRWEQSIWWKLLTDADKQSGVFAEHTIEGLLRGDIQSRYAAYQIALGNNNNPGFMTVNEVRALENLNPIGGEDELFSPQPAQKQLPQPKEQPVNE